MQYVTQQALCHFVRGWRSTRRPNRASVISNTLQPVLSSLQAHLNLGYLDDVTLGGPVEMVASDVAEIVNAGSKIGLSLNAAKCELIGHPDLVVNDTLLQSFERVEISITTLLGAPLLPGSARDHAWDKRCEELARAVDRLGAIDCQDGTGCQ